MGYNLKTDYDFSVVNSVMPDVVMSDICNELEKITKGFVVANVREYDGKIESYDTIGAMAALAASLQTSMRVDIQDKLGVIDETSFKYEMYLTASQIENYKYRILFIGYGITGYPAKIVLEQDIADELNNKEDSGYIYTVNSKTELEELLVSIFNSKTLQKIIQNLITASNRKLLEQKEAKATDKFLKKFDTEWVRYNRDLIQKVQDYEKENGSNN